ncbi:MAG: hypothetical protein Q7S21_06435 [archaeon]|nr:hypothetical protein [archaeon]
MPPQKPRAFFPSKKPKKIKPSSARKSTSLSKDSKIRKAIERIAKERKNKKYKNLEEE